MTKLYRVLGKRGRITIPFEIRQRVGFTYNDVLSFTESPDGRTVTVKREKICDNCSGTKTADRETEMTLEDFLDSLSAEQQRVALVHLSVKWAEQKAGGHNAGASVLISNGARLKVPRKARLYSNIRISSATARARTDSPKSYPKKLKQSALYMTASLQATA